MRQRKLKWADEYVDNNPLVIKEYPFNLDDIGTPWEMEIGCGKGNFILKKALANPNINYFGVEIQKSCLAIALKKIEDSETKINNVRFAYLNAKELEERMINKVDNIYLNFSDPWPKARHEKRRLTSAPFLEIYDKLLKEDGKITFRTDNYGLFLFSKESMNNDKFKIVECIENVPLQEGDIISEYEEKFREKGNPIYKIVAIRR